VGDAQGASGFVEGRIRECWFCLLLLSPSTFTLLIKNVPDASKLSLTFKALNTYIAPREHLTLQLRDTTP
jgi:hypothetical protein